MTLNLDKEYVLDIRMKAERAAYGEGIIKDLSYLTFKEDEFPYALRRELSWTHYRLIMRIENPNGREFYITECAEQNWNTRTLERLINTFYFERLLSSRDKKPKRSSIEGRKKKNA